MDGIEVNIKEYYANTKKQPLDQHLFAVGLIARQIILQFIDDDKLAKAVFVAGCLHDIGKIDPAFQNWILYKTKKKVIEDLPEEGQHIDKKSDNGWFEKHPRHNEISILLYHLMNDDAYKGINKRSKDRIKHILYWHHAKPIRKEEYKKLDTVYKKLKKNIGNAEFSTMIQVFLKLVETVNLVSKEYFSSEEAPLVEGLMNHLDEDRIYEIEREELAEYKHYSLADNVKGYSQNIKENAKNNLARAAVVTADRLVSSLSCETLNDYIEEGTLSTILETALLKERGLKQNIQNCLDGFDQRDPRSERNNHQNNAASKLVEVKHVGVLNGPAGCGKTKIALEWAGKTNARKIIWICPRIQVCQGLVKDLISPEYLPNAKIEINTGGFKTIYQSGNELETPEGEEFSGDIVLTTIDQVINTITTHSKVTGLVQYMNAHVIFDEYHEYINMPAFNLLFAELVECKKLQKNKANALLVSATPNYYFVNELLEIDDIVEMDSFNPSKYKIQFINFDEAIEDESNPLYQTQPKNTIVISNTAITAQKSFIRNQNQENAILIHSKYKKSDKGRR